MLSSQLESDACGSNRGSCLENKRHLIHCFDRKMKNDCAHKRGFREFNIPQSFADNPFIVDHCAYIYFLSIVSGCALALWAGPGFGRRGYFPRLRVNERFSGNSPAFLFLLVLHLFLQHTHSHLHPLLHSCLQLHPHQHLACRRHSTSAAAPLSSRGSRDGRPERNRENRKLIES